MQYLKHAPGLGRSIIGRQSAHPLNALPCCYEGAGRLAPDEAINLVFDPPAFGCYSI
jgi:hypothetical protein